MNRAMRVVERRTFSLLHLVTGAAGKQPESGDDQKGREENDGDGDSNSDASKAKTSSGCGGS